VDFDFHRCQGLELLSDPHLLGRIRLLLDLRHLRPDHLVPWFGTVADTVSTLEQLINVQRTTGIGTYSHVLIYRVVHILIPVATLELIEGFVDDAFVFPENQFLSGSRGT